MNHRFLIIIAAEDRDEANAFAKDHLDQVGGQNTFSIGLSASGAAPVTHFWCSALFNAGAEWVAALQAAFTSASIQTYDADADPSFPRRSMVGLGLKQIVNLPERPAWL